MPILSVEIIFNTDSGGMTMRGPSNPLVCADLLTRAVQTCLVNAAKQGGPKVETADAGLLRALPPAEKNGHP